MAGGRHRTRAVSKNSQHRPEHTAPDSAKSLLLRWPSPLLFVQNPAHFTPTIENLIMLSEHHDISHEFPEYRRMLDALRATDASFDSLVAKHDYIDDEIRQLEERQSPISDLEIERMKFERAALKDQIYQALRAEIAKA
jgi:hypothetical protein